MAAIGVVTLGLLVAACSSSDGEAAGDDDPTTTSAAPTTPVVEPCEPPVTTTPVQVTPVAGSESDVDVVSFDGTVIRAHWFPLPGADAADPAPTVLMGPGWSLAGDTTIDSVGVLGAIDIGSLRGAGYNVLTWDPRGFGESTGTAQVNSVDFEARDVQQLLDWVATLPEVDLDAERDPSVGMVGGSYGGGIQLVTAAIDCRVDALVPIVAWNSLQSSLYKADTVKSGWATKLTEASAGASVDPHVTSARDTGLATGRLSDEDRDWFISRGPGELVADITVPTLFVQGTVDTLFTLDEGVTNYTILAGNGVPVALLWYCDGHGVCLTDPGDEARVSDAAIGWLDRYVKGDTAAEVVAGFDIIDQHGVRYAAAEYSESDGTPLTASGSGTLELTAEGGAGPVAIPEGNTALLSGLVQSITPAPATNAVDVDLVVDGGPALVVGAPELTLTYSGTVEPGERPQRVFAQLVDASTGIVIGNQITPIAVQLDGAPHTVTVPLEMIAFAAEPGATITLQLVATTVAYAQPQLGGSITFDSIELSLPVATTLERVG
jgi:ABC-2 type transport system ATP-binding protein